MPAQRTRDSPVYQYESQSGWSSPSSQSIISFAPALTPNTFTFIEPSSHCGSHHKATLFPPSPDSPLSSPRRNGHKKAKAANHIPRPPNAFILFRSSFIKSRHVSTEVETNHSTLSKIIGLTWQNLPHDEKEIWHEKARVVLEEHKRKFPKYTFRPEAPQPGGKSAKKRRVRECEPKDTKRCAKIAELLVEGKKGVELDAAIMEFDRFHVQEVVTRFEAPITATTYKSRSGPASVADSEETNDSQTSASSSSSSSRFSTPYPDTVPPSPMPEFSMEQSFYDSVFDSNASSPESFSFPSTPEASFNFAQLTNEHPSPVYYDQQQSTQPINALGMHTNPAPRMLKRDLSSLSIDTSTPFADCWSSSSMPSPDVAFSPSDDAFAAIAALDQFDVDVSSQQQPLYGAGEYSPSSELMSAFDFGTLPSSKPDYPLDVEFEAFLSGLPSYC